MKKVRHHLKKATRNGAVVYGGVFVGAFAGALTLSYFTVPTLLPLTYDATEAFATTTEKVSIEPPVIHLPTPQSVKAIYMSQCVVGTPSFRNELVELIEDTELNSVVIDIKDYSGKLGFTTDNPKLQASVSDTCGATDIKEFIKLLHQKNIYVIGRITVFQDPYYTETHPELAIKKASATSTVWKDYKGLSFIDVGATPFWDYIVEISKEAHAVGFDELNFDYIRFPSDGNMKDIYFPWSNNRARADVLEEFFSYLSYHLRDLSAPLSADVFGMTTTNTDDLNIGQVLERTLPYFDYVAPMVYPSHYPSNFHGYSNPNKYPYEVVNYSMSKAVERVLMATTTLQARTQTPITTSQLRPWLQDFDYGGNYDIVEVKAQIKATYDAGLTSWMLWAPSNRYTKGALESVE